MADLDPFQIGTRPEASPCSQRKDRACGITGNPETARDETRHPGSSRSSNSLFRKRLSQATGCGSKLGAAKGATGRNNPRNACRPPERNPERNANPCKGRI